MMEFLVGQIAQLVEQRTENPCVGGSIPPLPIAVTCYVSNLYDSWSVTAFCLKTARAGKTLSFLRRL